MIRNMFRGRRGWGLSACQILMLRSRARKRMSLTGGDGDPMLFKFPLNDSVLDLICLL